MTGLDQLSWIDRPGLRAGGHLTLQERFTEWLETPDGRFVEQWVTSRALDLQRRGFEHYGIAALWEAARYSRDVQVGPNAGFKLNNDFRSRLARQIMLNEPRLAEFFETRVLTA